MPRSSVVYTDRYDTARLARKRHEQRFDVFHRVPAVDGVVPGAGDTPERLEAGSTIRHGPDGLVFNIYRVRVALRAQRLRRDESASMP